MTPETLDGRAVLDVAEAADLLKVSPRTVYKMVAAGRLPSIRVGRLIRIPVPALRRLLEGT